MCSGCIGIKRYTIVKVNITEVNVVIKHHKCYLNMEAVHNQRDLTSDMIQSMQEKESFVRDT